MLERLHDAWRRSDRLFGLLADEAWLEQPIPLRHPFVFYLGHLPAFAWNHLGKRVLGEPTIDPGFEDLFERGIDPVGVDAYQPHASWPAIEAIVAYRDRARAALVAALSGPRAAPEAESVSAMVLEHELMHHETLLYMVHELRHELKGRPAGWPELPAPAPAAAQSLVEVPAGTIELGAPRTETGFRWDNEQRAHRVEVAAFAIDRRPVTHDEFDAFVAAGGYRERRFWNEGDWAWCERHDLRHPHSWSAVRRGERVVRTLLEDVPFELAASWPVSVSHAEAAAYARWCGARLPTEAQWRRAAHGAQDSQRPWPWGMTGFDATRGNADFRRGTPTPAGSSPHGASAWGVLDLVGNGWEWTATPFAPFPGFAPDPGYPGYSADFFDGQHYVMLGGSWATDATLLRASFRNWFQPHYPYVFSAFRCVRDAR